MSIVIYILLQMYTYVFAYQYKSSYAAVSIIATVYG